MRPAEAEVQSIIDARIDALSRKDAQAAVDLLANDVVAFEMVGPLALPGGAAIDVEGTAQWMSSWSGPILVEVRDQRIVTGSDLAFVHALHRLSGERVNGTTTDMWMRSTLGLERRAGEWRIVHAHTSLPFDPANNFRARTDAKP